MEECHVLARYSSGNLGNGKRTDTQMHIQKSWSQVGPAHLWSGTNYTTTQNLSMFIAYSLGREISPSRRCQQARVSGWKHPGGESRGYQILYTLSTSLRNQGKALPLRHLSEPDPGGRLCQFSSGLRHWSLTWSCPRQQHTLTGGFLCSPQKKVYFALQFQKESPN